MLYHKIIDNTLHITQFGNVNNLLTDFHSADNSIGFI